MKKILLIEDDENLSVFLEEKMRGEGFEMAIKKDGRDIPAVVQKEKPDLILLDFMLPYKNGLEILDDLSLDSETKDIPVIVISNSGDPIDIDEFKKYGVKDYLIKAEFDLDELLKIVKKYLN